MAKPRVFISSTFYDLKHVRISLESFILTLGFDPVLSEKGSITYSPDAALDEACYREARACDIFVLIIGGRYGSEVSGKEKPVDKAFFEQYESITRKEYEAAIERDIPAYILIDKSVYSEYETFRKNRDNQTINYAHVDSVNIFGLIDYVLSRPRNNPVHHFEISSEIEVWLRNQWAGLFKELIRTRSEKKQLSSLADQVAELSNVSTTLKRYLEEVVVRVGKKEQAKEIIDEEKLRLETARESNALEKLTIFHELALYDVTTQNMKQAYASVKNLEDLAVHLESLTKGKLRAKKMLAYWHEHEDAVRIINEPRHILGLSPLEFSNKDLNQKPENKSKKSKT